MLRFLAKLFGRKEPAVSDQLQLGPGERAALEAKLGYQFRDDFYLLKALTHRSYLRQVESPTIQSYERLEFLGDSVLGLVVAEELFSRYSEMSEGKLTKNKSILVNKKVLAHTAGMIGLGDFIFMSPDEDRAGGRERQSILADCLEALFGAVYLDGGLEASRRVIRKVISFDFSKKSKQLALRNYKGELLERLQAAGQNAPRYTVSDEDGPDHQKVFTVEVFVEGRRLGSGRGDSKKSAEQEAAASALASLEAERIKEVEK
jgi:ribonuclease-3